MAPSSTISPNGPFIMKLRALFTAFRAAVVAAPIIAGTSSPVLAQETGAPARAALAEHVLRGNPAVLENQLASR
jgi:hypothetical protein